MKILLQEASEFIKKADDSANFRSEELMAMQAEIEKRKGRLQVLLQP